MENRYFDRDISWLSFNQRVLDEASDANMPLYERIKFLAIYSSNLDEFFRVRVAEVRSLAAIDKKKINKRFERDPKEILEDILQKVHWQQEEFGRIKREEIVPELRKNNIVLYRDEAILEEHKSFALQYFRSKILSYLQPIIMTNPKSRSPYLDNRALYFAVELESQDDQSIHYSHLNIPTNHLPRFIELPKIDATFYYIYIDDIIRENMHLVFPGYNVKSTYSIKLNRDADLNIEDEYAGDLVKKIRKQIDKRNLGMPSRFLYDSAMPDEMKEFIKEKFDLKKKDMIPGGRYHNMHDLFGLPNPLKPALENKSLPIIRKKSLEDHLSMFQAIDEGDVLLHFPYHTYDYVLRLFNEAALDPQVEEIKATFYRIASESFISNALISAANNGKKVTVFIEIKARFDEENNLKWANRMEEAGIKIIYSIPGLKVHAKVALFRKKLSDGSIKDYGYFGTGNFNEKTATLYADQTLLTVHSKMTNELNNVFEYLYKRSNVPQFKHLLVSQFNIADGFKEKIDREIDHVKAGNRGHIIIKLNNLQDDIMIEKLYEASNAGVKIELIVRAICCLIPGKKGMSSNITVRRIVDRYLEHSRIFYFNNGGDDEIYMGSADWMKRNLYRRVEVVFPVYDNTLKAEMRKFLEIQLSDNIKATYLDEKLCNVPISNNGNQKQAQIDFHRWLEEKEA